MDYVVKTNAGDAVHLVIQKDRHGVPQIYARPDTGEDAPEGLRLCHGWGARKTSQGIVEGILADGGLIEVPKADWKALQAAREDLRDQERLEGIHLVKIYSAGDRLTIDAYTLSAKVDQRTWKKIESCMVFVDSADNETLVTGDRFVGWVVRIGKEAEVERLLGIRPENSIFAVSPERAC